MPFLILSDIHANLEALEAVLADAQGRYERILCLGDLAGYGADPNAVVEWTRAHVTTLVRGNHDIACCGQEPLDHFNRAAQASALWTRTELLPENHAYLDRLPRGPLHYEGIDLVHGSPADEDEYLVNATEAALTQPYLTNQLTCFGHTHVQGGFLIARKSAKRLPRTESFQMEPDYFYLVNPGSVGQPRDRDPRAAYAIYTPETRTIEFRRASYRIAKAASKIRAAGLPDSLAARLYEGV